MNICVTAPEQTGAETITDPSIKNRLLAAAKTLFAQKGFAGTSVREICSAADASVPMINHYFDSKQGLYDAILGELSAESFDVPVRMIEGNLRSREEFLTKLELFISETLNALMAQAPVFRIIAREGGQFADLRKVHKALEQFLSSAQEKGYLRASLRTDLITGLIFDRLGNQVMFAVSPGYQGPNVLTDEAYRREWLEANTDALIKGFAAT